MLIRLAIVEDNHNIRNTLLEILSHRKELECNAIYSNAESFLKDFEELKVDVVLMDINLPGISGIECVRRIKPNHPEVQFLICTVLEDNDKIFDSLCAGATGYILKNTPPEKFFEAIKEIYQGGSPMSGVIARKVAGSFYTPSSVNLPGILSSREMEVLEYVSKGLSYKVIAEKLFISFETVRTHIRNIYEKLHVNSRIEALNKVFPRDSN
jgi:DNA-binding NarL/FixJ family response regulator